MLSNVGVSLLEEGKSITVSAWGYSMFPTIRPGDIITITPFTKDHDLKPGMVVAKKRSSGLVVHRVTHVVLIDGERVITTRGDSSLRHDDPFGEEEIAGVITEVKRGSRKFVPASSAKVWYRLNHMLVWSAFVLRKIRTILGLERRYKD